jgi:integrase/recombinase XerD
MVRQRKLKSLPKLDASVAAGSLRHQSHQFIEWERMRNYSEGTLASRAKYLRYFIDWCEERGLTTPQEITRHIIERYQRHLYLHRKINGEPLSVPTQITRTTSLRVWFKWLTRSNQILHNPAADLELPKKEKTLPKHILTAAEAERVMNTPDMATALGIRDRAMLETLYSTGMRRKELCELKQSSIDRGRGTVMIRQGKGKKDRLIPIGTRALAWIQKYCDEVRPELVFGNNDDALFLTQQGQPLIPGQLTKLVKKYIDAAKINKTGSCHLFRHTMATLMLENGADVRFIQEMLGHTNLTSTQIYTKVSIVKLKEVHTLTHPARLKRKRLATDDVQRADEGNIADTVPVEPGMEASEEAADET